MRASNFKINRYWIAAFPLLVIGLAAVTRGDAFAVPHLALSKSEPLADSTVTVAPKQLKLWFSEPVHVAMTSVRLVAQDSANVVLDKPTQATAAGSPVVFPVKGAMKAGQYRASWKTMGNDGHAVSGEFRFTLMTAR